MALRVLTWTFIIGISLILLIAVAIRFVDFSMSDEEVLSKFSGSKYQPEHKFFEVGHRTIHYVSVGDSSLPAVMFVHGSPGSWTDHINLLADPDLQNSFYMISLDRPGFGDSNVGEPERSLTNQANILAQILSAEKKTAILSGHSFGAPVVIKTAIDHPDLVQGLILVAGSVDPELEKTKWYQVPVDYQILSWILPPAIYSTNEEILALKGELEEMKPDWGKIEVPVSIIHGEKDKLVPVENVDFVKQQLVALKPEMIIVDSMNHFVPWSNPELIKAEIFRISALK
ncbi:MAG: alpha/beta hydrolase [Balneolaceae bacterium]|nr:alpha/beta hydrolase [Balneolaceae bacterium]